MGLRILAMGYKKLNQTQNLLRSDIEKNLTFLGLLIFENPVKLDSKQVISDLIMS